MGYSASVTGCVSGPIVMVTVFMVCSLILVAVRVTLALGMVGIARARRGVT